MPKQDGDKVKIVYLAANAVESDRLQLEEEFDQIKDELYASEYRDCFAEPVAVLSTNVDRLFAGILRHEPHIVHFSGHGTAAGELVLKASPRIEGRLRDLIGERAPGQPHLLGKEPLVQLLGALNRRIKIVVLNACFTEIQVRAIAAEIDHVIGMSHAVGDVAAQLFAVTFYQALAFGRTVQEAFDIAVAKLAAAVPGQADLPRLYIKPGVDVARPFLAEFDGAAGRTRGEAPPPARHLVVQVGSSPLKIHGHFCRRVVLGRSPLCEVSLEDAPLDVGNNHAQVSFAGPLRQYQVRDLESRHGTFVNDERVAADPPTVLHAGDEIRLGHDLRLFFRRQPDGDGEDCAALVRRDAEGREVACHVIAPHRGLVLGNGPGGVACLPDYLLAVGEVLGLIERTEDEIRFRPAVDGRLDDPVAIRDGERLDFPQLSLFFEIPGAAQDETATATLPAKTDDLPVGGPGKAGAVVSPPVPGELPPWVWKLDAVLAALAVVALVLTALLVRPESRDEVTRRWFGECRQLLAAGMGAGWRQTGLQVTWPPATPIRICTVATDRAIRDYGLDAGSLYGITAPVGEGVKFPPQYGWQDEAVRQMQGLAPADPWLLIYYNEGLRGRELQVSYLKSVDPKTIRANFSAVWAEGHLDGQFPRLITLGLCGAMLMGVRAAAVGRYRRGRRARYEAWQAERTRENFELKQLLDEARKLSRAGQGARALVLINQLLERKPSYDEAIDLKRAIVVAEGMTRPTPIGTGPRRAVARPVPADVPDLFLKILQTPYAYRAPRGFDRISLGRQRRRDAGPGGAGPSPDEAGNDVVIRVPGSDRLSLRISRRHLEIQRIDKEYYVVDLSGGQTALNGRPLAAGKPHPVVSGDRLSVAGTLAFEVQIQAAAEGLSIGKVVQVGREGARFEATIGDMVTELPHDG